MLTILQTPRIIVREYRKDETELVLALYRDEEVSRYVIRHGEEYRRSRQTETLKHYQSKTGLGRWGVFDSENGEHIGICKLMPNESEPEKIELGYVLVKKYWGKGIATELAKALVDYGFNHKGLYEIFACVVPGNTPSENVLAKAGFTSYGTVFWHGRELLFYKVRPHTPKG